MPERAAFPKHRHGAETPHLDDSVAGRSNWSGPGTLTLAYRCGGSQGFARTLPTRTLFPFNPAVEILMAAWGTRCLRFDRHKLRNGRVTNCNLKDGGWKAMKDCGKQKPSRHPAGIPCREFFQCVITVRHPNDSRNDEMTGRKMGAGQIVGWAIHRFHARGAPKRRALPKLSRSFSDVKYGFPPCPLPPLRGTLSRKRERARFFFPSLTSGKGSLFLLSPTSGEERFFLPSPTCGRGAGGEGSRNQIGIREFHARMIDRYLIPGVIGPPARMVRASQKKS